MNTLNIPIDINLVQYLTFQDCKNLKCTSKDTLKYIYHHQDNIKRNSIKIIKNFFNYTNKLFECGKKLDGELLYKFKNKNSKIFKSIKFTTVNLLYYSEYNNDMANSFIKGLHVDYKMDLVRKYFNFDENKIYSKYDLNNLITLMDFNDIFTIGL